AQRAFACRAGGVGTAWSGNRLRLARRRHARTSGGGSLRAQGRHQAAADHDQRRLAGDDGPHQRQRERRHHDLDLGAGANPRREGHPDRGHGERAARRISRSADVQGSGLRRPHGGDVVRAVGAGGLAERYHAAPPRGGGPEVWGAPRAQKPPPRRPRDARHGLGGGHRGRGGGGGEKGGRGQGGGGRGVGGRAPGGGGGGGGGARALWKTLTPSPHPSPKGRGSRPGPPLAWSPPVNSPPPPEPATPACCRTLAQRTVSDLTKRSSSSGEPLP